MCAYANVLVVLLLLYSMCAYISSSDPILYSLPLLPTSLWLYDDYVVLFSFRFRFSSVCFYCCFLIVVISFLIVLSSIKRQLKLDYKYKSEFSIKSIM